MISRWFQLKGTAIELRKKGYSIPQIETELKIPRSTLSGWLKNIVLTDQQKNRIRENWLLALNRARAKAIIWHHDQKKERLRIAEALAAEILEKIGTPQLHILELALAMLYLGEGFKKSNGTGLGNSDPLILKFFISVLFTLYGFDPKKIRCELHIRADQKPHDLKKFWSKELNIPIENFKNAYIDHRTNGSKTYPSYKGVCILRCGNVAIQRKLHFLANLFCNKVINTRAVSSSG